MYTVTCALQLSVSPLRCFVNGRDVVEFMAEWFARPSDVELIILMDYHMVHRCAHMLHHHAHVARALLPHSCISSASAHVRCSP